MRVCAITASAGRYSCLARNVRMLLEQDYDNYIHLIYQNSPRPLQLDGSIPEGKVMIINNHLDLATGQPYETLGAIYRDALTCVPEDVDVITHSDDDDLFFPNHISEGVKGIKRGGLSAYKPKYSYFLAGNHTLTLMENTMEPSIFVSFNHVKKYGYGQETSAQHLQWVNALLANSDIYSDPEGVPTMLYDWNTTGMPMIWKTSGDAQNPENMDNYRKYSQDYGNGILTPISRETVERYYNLIKRPVHAS